MAAGLERGRLLGIAGALPAAPTVAVALNSSVTPPLTPKQRWENWQTKFGLTIDKNDEVVPLWQQRNDGSQRTGRDCRPHDDYRLNDASVGIGTGLPRRGRRPSIRGDRAYHHHRLIVRLLDAARERPHRRHQPIANADGRALLA